jgi:hypothetical protein
VNDATHWALDLPYADPATLFEHAYVAV